MSNPTTPFGWQMPTNTDLVTDLPADFEVFGQAVATSMADLLGGTTGQVLSKASNTDMDFTWVTDAAGDITGVTAGVGISGGGTSGTVTVTNSMATAMTTSGDLIQATGSGTFARLGTGTSGQYLTTNGTTNSWVTPPTSGGMTLISEQAVSAVTSVTFSSIAQTYKQLYLVWSGIRHSTSGSAYTIRLNNNSTTIYRTAFLGFDATTAQDQDENATSIGGSANYSSFGVSANANQVRYDGRGYLIIDNYASTSRPKFVWGNWWFKHSTDNTNRFAAYNGIFDDTTAITSIDIVRLTGSATITNNNNSSIRLYGLS